MEQICVAVRIKGRVQGVFFRQSTREKALSLGLTGWVRNRSDGDVEAIFEGLPQSVQQILSWCEQGPSSARVDEVLVDHKQPTGDFSTFQIR